MKAYSYEYSDSGILLKFTNHLNGEVITYNYDYNGRFVSSSETKASNPNYKNQYSVDYDDRGRVIYATNLIDYLVSSTSYNATLTTYYQYNNDGTLEYENTTLPSGSVRSDYEYDEFLRLIGTSRTAGSFDQDISYTYYSNSTKTENLISTYTSTVNGTATTYNYTYDSKGNITQIVDSNGKTIKYYYDDLGQLTREINGVTGKTVIYSYDNAGNIKSKSVNESATYTYSSSQWGDLLTAYNGTAITYDNIGNPLSYYNGTSYTFTWDGRRLTSAVTSSKTMSFSYNDEGIRTSKTVNGVTTTYYVNGGQIVAESNNSRTIVYIYDATGSPVGMMYRTTSYAENVWDVFWYEKNLQGDVVAVYNSSGQKCITYKYDAWGNFTATASLTTGSNINAIANPFRYRSYYYDTDLCMYYLQSRYYDAKICRFINADNQLLTTDLIGTNLFSYCNNNPVMFIDPNGHEKYHWAIGLGIVAICGIALVATAGGIAAGAFVAANLINGVVVGSLASTIAAGAFIGSSMVLGAAALSAAMYANSIDDFYESGDWSTVGATAGGALLGGLAGHLAFKSYANRNVTTGRGTQNPKVQAAIKKGQEMHAKMDYGPGVVKEKLIAPGCRVDGIDMKNHIIFELKPNNPQAISRGLSQLERYTSAASQYLGGKWLGVLVLYN